MNQRAVLMSIKPKVAGLIFAATKTIELHRICLKVGPGDLVLVYVSSPRMALFGGFEFTEIISEEPHLLGKNGSPNPGWKRKPSSYTS